MKISQAVVARQNGEVLLTAATKVPTNIHPIDKESYYSMTFRANWSSKNQFALLIFSFHVAWIPPRRELKPIGLSPLKWGPLKNQSFIREASSTPQCQSRSTFNHDRESNHVGFGPHTLGCSVHHGQLRASFDGPL